MDRVVHGCLYFCLGSSFFLGALSHEIAASVSYFLLAGWALLGGVIMSHSQRRAKANAFIAPVAQATAVDHDGEDQP